MKKRTINITLPEDLVRRADEQAALEYMSRSEYIRSALINKLRIDEAAAAPDAEDIIRSHRRKAMRTYLKDAMEDPEFDPYE